MKRTSFILSAIILALGGMFAKAIGALYKIPLTNILGSNGMGLYYLMFPVYSLILSLCSSGIGVALATEVSKCRKIRHRYNEQKLLRVALVMGFVVSLIFGIIMVIIAQPLAPLPGHVNAKLGYIAIAPAIVISTIIATLRGYFQGVENMVPTTVSMIVEQVIKLSVGLLLAHKLCNLGMQYAVLGAVIGVTISELVALVIISINFLTFKGQLYYNYRNQNYKSRRKLLRPPILKSKKRYTLIKYKQVRFVCASRSIRYSNKTAIGKLFKIMLPATLSSILLPVVTMIDSLIIINILIEAGFTSAVSTSLYGLWGGVVQSLISLPTIIISALATSIVPSLSGVVGDRDVGQVGSKVEFVIKLTLFLSIIMMVGVFVFAEDILVFLYGDGLGSSVIDELQYATQMLKFASISIVYYALLQTFTAILQTIGKSHVPFLATLVGLAIRVAGTYFLVKIPSINIFGVIMANTIFLGCVVIILAVVISNLLRLRFKLISQLVMPIIIGSVVMVLMMILRSGFGLVMNYMGAMILSAFIGVIVYIVWGYFASIFNTKEKQMLMIFRKKKTIMKRR